MCSGWEQVDPHDNQHELVWMGLTHLLYVKQLMLSNSLWILAHLSALVNTFFKELVTHTGFEPMLTA